MKKISAFLGFIILYSLSSFAQIESGMIAHFPFNGNLNDISTSAIFASNAGSTFTTDRNGVANDAVDFNGIGHIVLSGNDLKVNFPISVSLWINLNSLSAVNTFFRTDNVYNNYYGIWMNNLPTGGISLSLGGGLGSTTSSNQRYFTTSDNFISAGSWHHIVGVIRSYNDMDLYIDCNKANGTYGGSGLTNVVYSSSGEQWIGGTIGNVVQPSGSNVDGAMDQFAFWNRELNAQEIQFLCDANNTLSFEHLPKSKPEIVTIYDLLGRETEFSSNTPLILEYSDGSRQKIYVSEH